MSDGLGKLYVLSTAETSTARVIGAYELLVNPNSNVRIPFHLHNALTQDENSPSSIIIILSHRSTEAKFAEGPQPSRPHAKVDFQILAAQVDTSLVCETGSSNPLQVLWQRRGRDVPAIVSALGSDQPKTLLLIGGSRYTAGAEQATAEVYTPKSDEIVPIPRPEDSSALGGMVIEATPPLPPPYNWYQTSDSVTVALALPSSIPSSSMKITITTKDLSILINNYPTDLHPHAPPLPRYLKKQFWADVDASSSFWTWDKTGGDEVKSSTASGSQKDQLEGSVGILTLHLEKKHEGTKWSHIFQSVGTGSSDPTDVEVIETVDPSELWKVKESLEKYTAALQTGGDASGLGLGQGAPSLGQGEYDEEVDDVMGAESYFTSIPLTGVNEAESTTTSMTKKYPISARILSKPLPFAGPRNSIKLSSLVIKQDIDGLLFEPPPPDQSESHKDLSPWTHKSTYPALAFVLASKQDTKFTFHISSNVVMVFESGNGRGIDDAGGNMFAYYGANGSKWGRQAVLKIGGGEAGALLGVCGMKRENGAIKIFCLCERQLIVITGVL